MPWGIINIRGSSDEKVDAANDSYDEIIAKFSKLRTDGDYAKKYTFTSSEEGQTITLESLFKKYTTAPSINERVESFNGILCADEGWVTLSKIGTNALCVTSDYYSAKYIKLVYHSSNDGSAYLSTNSGYLSATTKDEKVVICATSSQSNSARFYPVINGDGFALVSYTACKYLRLGDDGIFYADAECIEDATTFTLD
jgi:hypothetical protein